MIRVSIEVSTQEQTVRGGGVPTLEEVIMPRLLNPSNVNVFKRIMLGKVLQNSIVQQSKQ